MDPGEQTTGTSDEYYNLISVLYYALKDAQSCDGYALDAEAAGDEWLAGFFREAQAMQTGLAERAKVHLGILEVPPEPGIRPEGLVPSDAAPGDVPPATGVPRTPPEDVPEGTPADVPEAAVARIVPEDFESTISVLSEGVGRVDTSRAVAEVEAWERRLEASGDPELESIAGDLGALRGLLTADDLDAAGPLLTRPGEQVRRVAASEIGAPVAGEPRRLGELLEDQGRRVSG